MNRVFHVLIITLVLFIIMSTEATFPAEHRRMMAGAYSPVPEQDMDRVQHAAEFAVTQLSQASYSFASTAATTTASFQIVKAFQQVVAGMNYRLVIVLQDSTDKECVGAFAVTVYDHFGELSVTKWGCSMDCNKAKALLEEKDGFYEGYDKDFAS